MRVRERAEVYLNALPRLRLWFVGSAPARTDERTDTLWKRVSPRLPALMLLLAESCSPTIRQGPASPKVKPRCYAELAAFSACLRWRKVAEREGFNSPPGKALKTKAFSPLLSELLYHSSVPPSKAPYGGIDGCSLPEAIGGTGSSSSYAASPKRAGTGSEVLPLSRSMATRLSDPGR